MAHLLGLFLSDVYNLRRRLSFADVFLFRPLPSSLSLPVRGGKGGLLLCHRRGKRGRDRGRVLEGTWLGEAAVKIFLRYGQRRTSLSPSLFFSSFTWLLLVVEDVLPVVHALPVRPFPSPVPPPRPVQSRLDHPGRPDSSAFHWSPLCFRCQITSNRLRFSPTLLPLTLRAVGVR